MIRAYADEVAAAAGQSRRYPLANGVVRAPQEGHAVVEFPDPELDDVADGEEVKLVVDGRSYDAEVLEARRSHITLAVVGHPAVGPDVRTHLVVDQSDLPRRVRSRLETLSDEPGAFDARVADQLLKTVAAQLADPFEHPRLNAEQCSAVACSLTAGTTFLWGPPGTGKTTTLAVAIAEHVRAGRRVLVTSHTNAAVDLLLDRTATVLADAGDLKPGMVVRSGLSTPHLREAHGGILTPEGALAALGTPEYGLLLDLGREIDAAKEARRRLSRLGRDAEAKEWEPRLTYLEELRSKLRERIGHLERGVVREATVVATTAHRAAVGKIEVPVDVVVIDEASMVPVPLAWLVLGLARNRATVAGDFRQLAPIAQAETGAAMRFLSKSLFEYAGVSEAVSSGSGYPGLVTLRVQHRMKAEIADVIGHSFYREAGLQTAASVADRPPDPLLPFLPELAGIDLQYTRSFIGRGGSRFNPMSAQIVVALLEAGRREGVTVSRDRLLVLSPYRLQSRLLQKAVDDVVVGAEPIASTVHRAQGDEARTVIFDATFSRAASRPPRWFQGEGVASETSRLTNVALSRAQDQLVLLADKSRLVRRMPAGEPPRRAFEALLAGSSPPLSELLDRAVGAGSTFDWGRRSARDELLAAIERAKESVEIHLGAPRPDDEMALLEVADVCEDRQTRLHVVVGYEVDRGAKLRDLLELAERLRRRGALVDLRLPYTSNMAVVDGETLWTTFDQLFSSSTTVYRTVGRALANEVMQVSVFRPSNIGKRLQGRLTDDCPTCGKGRAAIDTFYFGKPEIQLRCIRCDRLDR